MNYCYSYSTIWEYSVCNGSWFVLMDVQQWLNVYSSWYNAWFINLLCIVDISANMIDYRIMTKHILSDNGCVTAKKQWLYLCALLVCVCVCDNGVYLPNGHWKGNMMIHKIRYPILRRTHISIPWYPHYTTSIAMIFQTYTPVVHSRVHCCRLLDRSWLLPNLLLAV